MKKQLIHFFTLLILIFSATIFAQEKVTSHEATGVEIDDNNLTKTAAYGWNAGAASKNVLPEGEDGWFEFTIAEAVNNKRFWVGWSDRNELLHPYSIDYGFYLVTNNRVYFYEGNKYKGCLLYTSPSPRDRTRSRMPSSA